jgi:hypothetical protein
MIGKAAYNERFGAMSAVPRRQFARYYPAGSSVEAATAPSRRDVIGKRADSTQDNDSKK